MSSENTTGIYTAVMIEYRISDLFELVLDNFYGRLDKRWNFMIFCTNNNANFLLNLIFSRFPNEKSRTTIVVLDINEPIAIDKQYKHFVDYDINKIYTSEILYNMIPTETILMFQLDTLLSDKYYNNIYDFLEYDYVGAPWIGESEVCGNGGLSLRKKSKMLEIINDKNYYLNADKSLHYNEDTYFSHYPNINSPKRDLAKKFSVETYYYDKPAGIHKAFAYINEKQYKELMTHFPKLNELHMKHNYLCYQTINITPNPDRPYKTDFFKNCKIINFQT